MNLHGGRRGTRVPEGDRPPPVAACPLIMEAVSARLDGEEAVLPDRPVDDHLARCGRCRAFERAARSLRRHPATSGAAAEPAAEWLVASVVATAPDGAVRRVGSRLARHLTRRAGAVPWGIGVIALGLALPPVALTSAPLTSAPHLHAVSSGGSAPCSLLLHHLHPVHRQPPRRR